MMGEKGRKRSKKIKLKSSGGPPDSWGFWDVVAFQREQREQWEKMKAERLAK